MKFQVLVFTSFLLGIYAELNLIKPKDLVNVHNRSSGSRIINGQLAEAGQFPYQVAVYYVTSTGNIYFCGGTLVSDQYVLTAAHCTVDALLYSLFLGGTNLNSYDPGTYSVDVDASAAVVHPGYNPTYLSNDIALIRLPVALEPTELIRPIRLPERGETTSAGSSLVISGWGVTETSTSIVADLLYAPVTSISNLQCAIIYGTAVVIDSTLCAVGSSSEAPCNGDSGGPLISFAGTEPTLAGVISFIHRDGCNSGNPAGYVRVEAQLDFILNVIDPEPEPTVLPEVEYEY